MIGGQGAIFIEGTRCRFRVWAPERARVELHLTAPDPRVVPMAKVERGYFEAILDDVHPGARYRYRLDDEAETLPDPASRWQPDGVHGDSAVFDPKLFVWTDQAWDPPPQREWVVYELHVGTFTPEGTFDAAVEHLEELQGLGVTTIEVMPLAQFPGERNWGYDGVFPFAVQDSYGGPQAFQRFVDAAHRIGLAVVLDVVYNHLGPEGNRLRDFGPYFTERYSTPWGDAINVDGPGSDEVRAFFADDALMWIEDFHCDGLRFDAIHGILDTSASPFLAELTDALHARALELGRRVVLIAESESNDRRVVTPTSANGLGFDAQWSDDFHHAVHTLLTGERLGYYADYGTMEDLETAVREGFVYDGRYSAHLGRRRGSSSRDLPTERLVVCVQNHDQVGNRMRGERLASLVDFEQQKLAAGLLLLSPYVPMLFMGEEYGETNPFLYFISHTDAGLVEAVRKGRAQEFASFQWSGEVPDPYAEATFQASKLDRSKRASGRHRILLELHAQLLSLRRREAPLARAGKEAMEVRTQGDVLALRRWADGRGSLAVFNFGARADSWPLPDADWTVLLDAADARLGGPGALGVSGGRAHVQPHSFVLLASEEVA